MLMSKTSLVRQSQRIRQYRSRTVPTLTAARIILARPNSVDERPAICPISRSEWISWASSSYIPDRGY